MAIHIALYKKIGFDEYACRLKFYQSINIMEKLLYHTVLMVKAIQISLAINGTQYKKVAIQIILLMLYLSYDLTP